MGLFDSFLSPKKQIEADYERENLLMDDLKAKGKEKCVTCRQYIMYTKFLAIYKVYGLRE